MKQVSLKSESWPLLGTVLFFALHFHVYTLWGQSPDHNHLLNHDIKVERLTVGEGLSSNTVTNLLQDRKGFMWFATREGLQKFDGYAVTLYQNNPKDSNSLSHNDVSIIYEDRAGLLWIGTADGGVNSFDPQKEKWQRFLHDPKNPNSPAKGVVHAILEDRFGNFWFGTVGGGLTRYDPALGLFTRYTTNSNIPNSLRGDDVLSLVEDKTGKFWVATNEGLNLLDRKTNRFRYFELKKAEPALNNSRRIHHMQENKEGLLWMSSDQGIYVFDPKTEKVLTHYYHDPAQPNSLSYNSVLATAQDQEGNYWVATNEGLNKLNTGSGHFTLFRDERSFPENTEFHAILVDKSGLVWLSNMGSGVFFFSLRPSMFRRYLHEEDKTSGLGNIPVNSIFQGAADKQLYVATLRELLRYKPDKEDFSLVYRTKSYNRNYSVNNITSACEVEPGVFWLGTVKNGIIVYDSHTGKESFLRPDSLAGGSLANTGVDVVFRDRNGTTWVGTDGGHLQWYDAEKKRFNTLRYLPEKEKVPDHTGIRFIYEDRQGYLWVGIRTGFFKTSGKGLYRLNRATGDTKHYSTNGQTQNNLNTDVVTCLYEDQAGILWIGTYGRGMIRLNPKTGENTVFTKEEGLQSNTVQAITGDKAGHIWILENTGITRFHAATYKTHWFELDGLSLSGTFSTSRIEGVTQKRADGTILFGNANGLVAFHPEKIKMNTYPPPVAITSLKVLNKNAPFFNENISLPYDRNFIEFGFTALNYLSPSKNQYAYKLEGLDKDWIFSGTHREARYTNLSPGKYTFRVKAANNDGVWNEEGASVNLIIHPPFWLTWWAYGLYALTLVGSVWGFVAYRSRRLQKENRMLEDKVTARTAEVLEQKEEITKQKEEIEAQRDHVQQTLHELQITQHQLVQKEKMASLGELTAGIAHEIRNPLNFVNNFSEVSSELLEELEQEVAADHKEVVLTIAADLRQNLQKIHHHGRRADAIVKNMLLHSRPSAGEKQLTNLNDLTAEYLRLAYYGIRAKDKNFTCTIDTSYDLTLEKVEVVPQELGRVLLNLFNNAFYAVQQKQKMSLAGYEPKVTVSTGSQKGRVTIRVWDNGTGMSESVKSKIFQPFFTTKPTGQGTGLGLSLSYDIVTKGHEGGELAVATEEGKWSEFTIVLPYVPIAEAVSAAPADPLPPAAILP